jgi:hypothetical protein
MIMHDHLKQLTNKLRGQPVCMRAAVCACGLLYSTHSLAGSEFFIDTEATLGLDDNVTRAANNIDIEHDGFLTLAATGGYELIEGRAGLLTAKAHLEANRFFRFNGLSNLVAAGRLNYAYSFGSGFGVPWVMLEGEYGVAEFESLLRDSNIARASLTLGMQIDDATSVRLGASFKDRDAESAVFDTRNTSAFISLDWAVQQKHIVYLTYKYQTGDTFSSVTPSLPDAAVITAILDDVDIVVDDVFEDKVTYKLDADIQFITLGYNWIQDLHSSFDFSAQYLESRANDVDVEYQDLVLRATYFRRFDL